jgi:integrase
MSVNKRNGSYQVRWREEPGGPQKTKTFKKRGDADEFDKVMQADLVRGTYVSPDAGNKLFGEYARTWQAAQVHHRPNSAKNVETHLRAHLLPQFGDRRIGTIRTADVQAWVKVLTATHAPRTVGFIYATLSTIMAEAVEDQLIARSPCSRRVKLPEVERKHVRPLTTEQVWAWYRTTPERYRAMILVGAGSGLRPGELLGLQRDRFNPLRRELRVDQQLQAQKGGGTALVPPKTKASYRTVPISADVVAVLNDHLAKYPTNANGLVFTNEHGEPIKPNWMNRVSRHSAEAAGLPAGTHLHELRHYYASLLIDQGASIKEVQSALGHASATLTLNTYSHLFPNADDTLRAATGLLFERPDAKVRTLRKES